MLQRQREVRTSFHLIWRQEHWTCAVSCACRLTNDCPDDNWLAEYWKIICAHSFDSRIVTGRVVCSEKILHHDNAAAAHSCASSLVAGPKMFHGPKFHYDALYHVLPLPTRFSLMRLLFDPERQNGCTRTARETTSKAKRRGSRRITSLGSEGFFEQ